MSSYVQLRPPATHGGSTPLPVQRATVSVSSSGDNSATIAAPGSGKKLVILSYFLVAAGAITVTLKGGATALTGAMPIAANGSGIADRDPAIGLFDLAENTAFVINLGSAVAVTGYVSYVVDDV